VYLYLLLKRQNLTRTIRRTEATGNNIPSTSGTEMPVYETSSLGAKSPAASSTLTHRSRASQSGPAAAETIGEVKVEFIMGSAARCEEEIGGAKVEEVNTASGVAGTFTNEKFALWSNNNKSPRFDIII